MNSGWGKDWRARDDTPEVHAQSFVEKTCGGKPVHNLDYQAGSQSADNGDNPRIGPGVADILEHSFRDLLGDIEADEVTVRGTTLKGRVLDLEASGIHFKTIYGEGNILIRYEETENVQTPGEFHIYHSDGQKIQERLLGKEG